MAEKAILTELTYTWFGIFFLLFILVGSFIGIAKRIKDLNNKIIRVCVIVVIAAFFIGVSANIIVSVEAIPMITAYNEYKNNNTKEDFGCIDEIIHDKAKKHIIIDGQKYVLLNGLEVNVKEGQSVKIVSGYRSNYIFELEPYNAD